MNEIADDRSLLKKTLMTMAAMVGALVVLVGSICLIALLVVGKAVQPAGAGDDKSPATVSPEQMGGKPASPEPSAPKPGVSPKVMRQPS
jgi:hypothetical protein